MNYYGYPILVEAVVPAMPEYIVLASKVVNNEIEDRLFVDEHRKGQTQIRYKPTPEGLSRRMDEMTAAEEEEKERNIELRVRVTHENFPPPPKKSFYEKGSFWLGVVGLLGVYAAFAAPNHWYGFRGDPKSSDTTRSANIPAPSSSSQTDTDALPPFDSAHIKYLHPDTPKEAQFHPKDTHLVKPLLFPKQRGRIP